MQGHTAHTRTHIHTGQVLTRESNEDRRQNQTSVSHYSQHRAQKTLPIGGGRVSVQAGGGAGGGKKKKKKRLGGRRRRRMLRHRYLPRDQIFSESPRVPLSRRPVLGGLQGGRRRRRVARGQKESPTSHLATPPRHSQSWNLEVWVQISRTGRGGGRGLGWGCCPTLPSPTSCCLWS